jgi:hypothetical protein
MFTIMFCSWVVQFYCNVLKCFKEQREGGFQMPGRAGEMKIVFAGHSFIRRLRDYCNYHPFQFPEHPITESSFCCQGGWKLRGISSGLSSLSNLSVSNSIVYLEIGTNDLCDRVCQPKALAASICALAVSVLARGAAFVIIGEPLPRYGRALAMVPNFAIALQELIAELHLLTDTNSQIKVWRHEKIVPKPALSFTPGHISVVPDTFLRDGVHLRSCSQDQSCPVHCQCGMRLYWRSVRGALLHAFRATTC